MERIDNVFVGLENTCQKIDEGIDMPFNKTGEEMDKQFERFDNNLSNMPNNVEVNINMSPNPYIYLYI